MRCPRCGFEDSAVVDSRGDANSIRRRRECESCHFRFTTYERVELSLPMVVKKDGRREPFDREKLRAGLVRACEKTPVSVDAIDKTVEAIEAQIVELFVKEIPSRQIGDFLMESLKGLDKIAYVRFASVYREFLILVSLLIRFKHLRKREWVIERDREQMESVHVGKGD